MTKCYLSEVLHRSEKRCTITVRLFPEGALIVITRAIQIMKTGRIDITEIIMIEKRTIIEVNIETTFTSRRYLQRFYEVFVNFHNLILGRRGNSGGTTPSSASNNNKNERANKNKNRNQSRNERNTRRVQASTEQDPDAICVYYMQGKCHRGDDCPYSHNALPPRKMELCKFYLMDCCAKRDKCLYMHHDFPCKFFHTGMKCSQGDNCKFSHEPLNEQVILNWNINFANTKK